MTLNREKLRQLAGEIPVIILAGGLGTRLSEETAQIPKPMVKIGSMPIILHIMDYYAKFGFRNFAICGGYKVEVLRDYFMQLPYAGHDVEISFAQSDNRLSVRPSSAVTPERLDWNLTILETGLNSMTGYRIAKAVEYLNKKGFQRYAVTYGDGLTDVDLHAELDFHLQHKQMGTVLGVHQPTRFGIFRLSDNGQVEDFSEKPQYSNEIINGGYFFFEKGFEKYIADQDANCVFEQSPLVGMTREKQLFVYRHEGFWQCMDTMREKQLLEKLYESQKAPWTKPLSAQTKDPAMTSHLKLETNCRGCGSATLQRVLSIGNVPLANSLLKENELKAKEDFFPLTLALCTTCTLPQIEETIDPERMFRNYFYQSSFSSTMLKHASSLADDVIKRFKLNDKSLVAEIASNDGYLLKNYKRQGVPVVGIEPAQNIAKIAIDEGIATIVDFFGDTVARKMVNDGVRADIIHANNVMAHVPAINDVLAGFRTLLKPDGSVISESPYLRDMVKKLEFDTIYHEHLFYYSLKAQDFLFKKAGLTIYDAEELDIHGGSLRIFAKPSDSKTLAITPRLQALMKAEDELGMGTLPYFQNFAKRVEQFGADLRKLVTELKSQGKRIAAYGCSAKGSTLMHYCDIGRSIDYIVDMSTLKQKHFSPGYHHPIKDPKFLLEDKPDYVLLLTWNFADEILKAQDAYRKLGGKFIVPIPEIKIV